MKQVFEDIPYFCATSDIWSRSNRSFIAVTVHFFEPKSLQLKTKFIACEHFTGRHTHDKVALKLHSIFDRYNILRKVFFITTDGAGEYVAAFKYFGDNYRSIHLLNTEEEEDLTWLLNATGNSSGVGTSNSANAVGQSSNSIQNSTTNEDDSESESVDTGSFVYTGKANQNESDMNDNSDSDAFVIHELPSSMPLLAFANRVDCAAHKLDKLGKIDAVNAKTNNSDYAQIYDRVFGKLETIWNLKDSRLSAEIFEKITGKKLTGPHRIRWLKTFESVIVLFFLSIIFVI